MNGNGVLARVQSLGLTPLTAIGGRIPSFGTNGTGVERYSDGELVLYSVNPSTGSIEALPPGSASHAAQIRRAGYPTLVYNQRLNSFQELSPRRRSMNALNLRALRRAHRRIDAAERVLKRMFRVKGGMVAKGRMFKLKGRKKRARA